jgi:hypothetical protein
MQSKCIKWAICRRREVALSASLDAPFRATSSAESMRQPGSAAGRESADLDQYRGSGLNEMIQLGPSQPDPLHRTLGDSCGNSHRIKVFGSSFRGRVRGRLELASGRIAVGAWT